MEESKASSILRKLLKKHGYGYRKDWMRLPGMSAIVLTKYKIAVFCDGEFCQGKDYAALSEADKKLLYLGWKVIHFRNEKILKEPEDCLKTIEEAIFENKLLD